MFYSHNVQHVYKRVLVTKRQILLLLESIIT